MTTTWKQILVGPLENLDSFETYAEATRRATQLGWQQGEHYARIQSGVRVTCASDAISLLREAKRSSCKTGWTAKRILREIRVQSWRGLHGRAIRAAFAGAFEAAIVQSVASVTAD